MRTDRHRMAADADKKLLDSAKALDRALAVYVWSLWGFAALVLVLTLVFHP